VERGGSTHTSSKYLDVVGAQDSESTSASGAILSISSNAPTKAKAGPYQLRAIAISVCIVMMLHTRSASRVVLKVVLMLRRGRGCVFIAQPMESRWRAREEACRLQARGNNDARSVNWLSRSESS
jgi:hypothetical protein